MKADRELITAVLRDQEFLGMLLGGATAGMDIAKKLIFQGDERLFYDEPVLRGSLCQRICETESGRSACFDCDKRLLQNAIKDRKATVDMCHAGLMGVAVPILLDTDYPGAILAGGVYPCKEYDNYEILAEKARRRLRRVSNLTSIPYGELQHHWSESRKLTPQDADKAKDRLSRVGAQLSKTVSNVAKERAPLEERQFILETVSRVATLQELPVLRSALPGILRDIANTYKATGCGILTTIRAEAVNDYIAQAHVGPNGEQYHLKSRHSLVHGTSRQKVIRIEGDNFLGRVSSDESEAVRLASLKEVSKGEFGKYLNEVCSPEISRGASLLISSSSLGRERKRPLSRLLFWMLLGPDSQPADAAGWKVLETAAESLAESLSRYYRNSELYTERRDFLGDVAHQILTPLVNAESNADLLLRDFWEMGVETIENRLNETRGLLRHCRMWTQSFQKAATRGEIEDLLSSSELVLEEVNLAKLMIEVGSDFRARARDKGISIKIDDAALDRLGDQLMAEDWIRHALMCLVDNAVKYSVDYGDSVELSGTQTERFVELCIRNTSPWEIPDHEAGHIYDRWFRGARAEEGIPEGTGLGLAIAKAVAQAHGGDIAFEQSRTSTKHKEAWVTTFMLVLPKRRGSP